MLVLLALALGKQQVGRAYIPAHLGPFTLGGTRGGSRSGLRYIKIVFANKKSYILGRLPQRPPYGLEELIHPPANMRGKMKPPRKPDSMVMEMAGSLAKAVTRYTHQVYPPTLRNGAKS